MQLVETLIWVMYLGLSLFILVERKKKKSCHNDLPEMSFLSGAPVPCGCQNLQIISGDTCLKSVMEGEPFIILSLYNQSALKIDLVMKLYLPNSW